MADNTHGKHVKSKRWTSLMDLISVYKYIPLTSVDCTRLFLLWPKSDGDGIQGQLVEVEFESLERRDDFSALSYHWGGTDSPTEWISLYKREFASVVRPESPLTARRFRVKKNLFHALEALRLERNPILLWVDALCINQNDPIEKEHQLAKINLAYELAPSVIIWLGPEDIETGRRKQAIDFVKLITAEDTSRKVESMASDELYLDRWMSLVELTQLSWFSRKWVIQELALAKDAQVRCGSQQVPWHDLQVAIYLMERYSEQIRQLAKNSREHDHNYHAVGDLDTLEAKALADTVHNMFKRDKDGAPGDPNLGLEYLVSALACFYSSDPRDTINAFRNISREQRGPTALDDEKAPPKPTYKLDKTLADIYVDFFRWVYETSGSIDIICRKWALPENLERPARIVASNERKETEARQAEVPEKNVKREYTYPKLSKIPSYIQTVSMPAQNGRTSIDASTPARTEGVSLVGLHNASRSMPAQVHFNDTRPVIQGTDIAVLASEETNEWSNGPTDSAVQEPRRASLARDPTDDVSSEEDKGAQRPRVAPYPVVLDGVDMSNVARADGARTIREARSTTHLHGRETNDKLPFQNIRVRGLQVGTITWHTSSMQQGLIHNDVIKKLAPDFARKRTSGTQTAPTDISDKLWRGLVAERGADGDNPPPTYLRACRYIFENCVSRDLSLNVRELRRDSKFVDFERDYLNRVYAVSYNRSFFEATQMTYGDDTPVLHGFGPAGVVDTDIICVLFGCSVPVVLRRGSSQGQGEYYTLVGECYTYGLMDGEAILSMNRRFRETGVDTARDFILY